MKKIINYFLKNLKNIYNGFLDRIDVYMDFWSFNKLSEIDQKPKFKDRKLIFSEKSNSHSFDAHYIYHPAWAIRILKKLNPKKHIDISSVLSFSTQLSAFIPTEYYDYRIANVKLNNFKTKFADLMNLPFEDCSIESLSCMHTVEHIGLGRYGDTINPEGDRIAMKELQRVMKKGGYLLFVVPIGRSRICFNAHRVYSYKQIIKEFDKCVLKEFVVLLDDYEKGLQKNVPERILNKQNYACGCFLFKKN
jgi:SAM-dependent methyltransferase